MLEKEILDKAIIKLGRDNRLIFTGLELSNLASPNTSLKNKLYKEDHFVKDLQIYLPKKFMDLTDKRIAKIWKQFKKIFKKLDIFENIDEFQNQSYQIYLKHFNAIKNEIFNQLDKLNVDERFGIYIFLKNGKITELQNNIRPEILLSTLKEISNKDYAFPIVPNIGDLLIRTGILFSSSYIDTKSQPSGVFFTQPKYLIELALIIIDHLLTEKGILNLIKEKKPMITCKDCNAEYPSQEDHCPFCGAKN